ncbi:AraC family transcriptional regulator [Sphingosinicella xenopeptidilytica]|uniref:AraC family transcriptional regulator n=1 Tax=Sphingosinicella xenopeptidilytica TaxID=364098 RepID=A0ABW3C383_SPHXN
MQSNARDLIDSDVFEQLRLPVVRPSTLSTVARQLCGKHGDSYKFRPEDRLSQNMVIHGPENPELSICAVKTSSAFVSETVAQRGVNIMIPLEPEFSVLSDRKSWEPVAPASVLVSSPGRPQCIRWPEGGRLFALRISRSAFEGVLSRAGAAGAGMPMHFSPIMDLNSEGGEAFSPLLRALAVDVANDEALFQYPDVASAWATLIASALLRRQPNNVYRKDEGAREEMPAFVKTALDYIDRRLQDEDLCRASVVAASGVPARTLHYWFKKLFCVGPIAYARQLRLYHIRAELMADDQRSTIADIAARWGFYDGSAFAAAYRAMFGELPSVTVKRREGCSALPKAI